MTYQIKDLCHLENLPSIYGEYTDVYEKGLPPGISTGWPGLDRYFKILKGQLTVITGTPGSGKSEFVDNLAVNLAITKKWRVLVYSPENYPSVFYLSKLAEKIVGKPFETRGVHPKMDKHEMANAHQFIADQFDIIRPTEEPYNIDNILFTAMDAKKSSDLDMVVIDPWNNMQHAFEGKSETEFIRDSLVKIRGFARRKNIAFFLVAHPTKIYRKKDGTYPEPSLYDISGSSNWFNLMDNGIILHRGEEDKKSNNYVKVMVKKIKNRFYGSLGDHCLEFLPHNGRYADYYPKKTEDKWES